MQSDIKSQDVSMRLDPSPKTDSGHYVDVAVPCGAATVRVPSASTFDKVYVIGAREQFQLDGDTDDIDQKLEFCPDGLPFDSIVAEAEANVNVTVLAMPGKDIDLPLSVDIVGEGADVKISGLYLCSGADKMQIRTEVRHRVPSCVSMQLFNGIASGKSKARFYGKIVVAPDAQKTEAYQTNHNLILSDGAEAEAKPQLEIYADDVKCSHGATVGQLNEDEQFYMRSRGIPEEEAKVLQMISFIAPVLANVADEDLRAALSSYIETAVREL